MIQKKNVIKTNFPTNIWLKWKFLFKFSDKSISRPQLQKLRQLKQFQAIQAISNSESIKFKTNKNINFWGRGLIDLISILMDHNY